MSLRLRLLRPVLTVECDDTRSKRLHGFANKNLIKKALVRCANVPGGITLSIANVLD